MLQSWVVALTVGECLMSPTVSASPTHSSHLRRAAPRIKLELNLQLSSMFCYNIAHSAVAREHHLVKVLGMMLSSNSQMSNIFTKYTVGKL